MFDKLPLFRTDEEGERAVSPVIGVILMVAITVILAAVIASFVLGLGDTDDPAPTISFEDEVNDDGNFEISITSGDSDADAENLQVVGEQVDETWNVEGELNESGEDNLGAGQSVEIDINDSATDDEVAPDEEIDLIWDDDDVLYTAEVPSDADD